MAGSEIVQVVRKPGKDGFGKRLPGEPQTWNVPGFQFAPGPSLEVGAGTGQVETDGTLYGPPKTEIDTIVPDGIQPTDHIRVRGDLYQVVGRVQDWLSSGTVIVLKFVTG